MDTTVVVGNLRIADSLVMDQTTAKFPANPSPGMFAIRGFNLFIYLSIGTMDIWYPILRATDNVHVHTQGIAGNEWIIQHNLGTVGIWFQAQDQNGNILSPSIITSIDNDSFKLDFSTSVIGTVIVASTDSVSIDKITTTVIQLGNNVVIDTTGMIINGQRVLTSITNVITDGGNQRISYSNTEQLNLIPGDGIALAFNDTNKSITVNATLSTDTTTAINNAVSSAIDAETTSRTATDIFIQHEIDTVTTTLLNVANRTTTLENVTIPNLHNEITAEVNRATLAETNNNISLNAAISSAVAVINSEISLEITTRNAADLANTTLISSETNRAESVEAGLATNLANEIAARIAADAAEVDARAMAIVNAENSLQVQLNMEISRASSEEAILNGAIISSQAASANAIADLDTRTTAWEVALSQEITDVYGILTNSINTTNTAVTAENNRAESAETILTSNLNTEIADRIAGDTNEAQLRTTAIAVSSATAANATATEAAARIAGDNDNIASIVALQNELNITQVGSGLNIDGTFTAPVSTTYLSTAISLKDVGVKLDTALATEVTTRTGAVAALGSGLANEAQLRQAGDDNLQTQLTAYINSAVTNNTNADNAETAARIAADSALQTELNNLEATVGASIDGTLIPITGTHYLDNATTVFGGAAILDGQIYSTNQALAAEVSTRATADTNFNMSLQTEITNRAQGDSNLQVEINAIESGAGLDTNGAYTPATDSNYLNAATSLKDADHKLDAALMSVSNRTTTIETTSIPNLQTQITAEVSRSTSAEALLVPKTITVNGHPLSVNVTVTKADVGLSNVDNTSDVNKPVSIAQTAADTATLNSSKTYTDNETTRATAAESTLTTNLASEVTSRTNAVSAETTRAQAAEALLVPKTTTVNGHALSANVVVTATDIGLGNVNNTSDLNKPVSTAQAAADTDVQTAAATDATTKANNAQAAAIAASAPIAHVGSGGTAHASVVASGAAGFMTGADKAKLDGISAGATANGGTVTNVSGIGAINVATGTTTPVISIVPASITVPGTMSSADKVKLDAITGTNTGDQTLAGLGGVPNILTVNGHALNANISITKTDISLGNVDNTSDVNKPVSTAQAAADTATLASAKSYADGLVVGLWDDRGSFNASVNTYPTTNGSGSAGAILKGDIWTISVAATAGPLNSLPIGSTVRAVINAPGQTAANWAIAEVGLGYVPYNATNPAGYISGNQAITLSGDAAGTGTTSIAVTVSKLNGVALSALGTGLLKNTTGTGVPSIAVAGTDYQLPIGTISGLVKGNGANALIAATSADVSNALGFTPIQQGGGTGQGNNKVYIGWTVSSMLSLQIDATNFGTTWPIAISGNAATATSVPYSGLTGSVPTWNQNTTGSSASCTGNAASATYLSATQQTSVITGKQASMSMSQDGGATVGSFVCKATGTGDANLAGMTYWNDAYATKMGIRADGYFGLGGWSRAAWSWYSDPSGNMVAAGNVTAYSDPRLKDNVRRIVSALDICDQLDGVRFTWNYRSNLIANKSGKQDIGVLADQVKAILPEIVSPSIMDEENGETYDTVAYEKLVPILLEAIKELRTEVNLLKSKLNA